MIGKVPTVGFSVKHLWHISADLRRHGLSPILELMESLRILIIEDDITFIKWYELFFSQTDFPKCETLYLSSVQSFREQYEQTYFDLALIDYYLPDGSAEEIVQTLKFNFPQCYLAMVSCLDNADVTRRLFNYGVDIFLKKPLVATELQAMLNLVFDQLTLSYSNLYSDQQNSKDLSPQTGVDDTALATPNIIYQSKSMENIIGKMLKISQSDSTVLIRGESGTGKELVARSLHAHSSRRDKPFVEFNIAALPESLIESELFGYKKGAFTGADSDRQGRFAAAQGGTIFIDEIGDIPPQVQVKLLRMLQFKEYQRIGDNTTYTADVRIVAATSRNLEDLIERKTYREDLYYRLSVITLTIPPLRERKADLPPLIDHFLSSKAQRHGKENASLTGRALSMLQQYSYPGNIRELENIIEHGIILSRSGTIGISDLPDRMVNATPLSSEDNPWDSGNLPADSDSPMKELALTGNYNEDMVLMERLIISKALQKHQGNQAAAARSLGISERRLRYRLQITQLENSFRK